MHIDVSHEEAAVPVTILHLDGALTTEEELEARRATGDRGRRPQPADRPFRRAVYGDRRAARPAQHLRVAASDSRRKRPDAVRKGISSGTYASAHLKLLKPTKHTLETLRTAGYDMFLEIYDDRKKALASF